MLNPTLLVMAAGMGSRYGGLKQIDPVGPHGETILEYSVYDAIRAGFGKLVFVIRRDIEEAFKRSVGRKFEDKIPLDYSHQSLEALPPGFAVPSSRSKPWGTGHAILSAVAQIREPFAAINADDFYGAQSFRLIADHLKQARDTSMADYSMAGFVLRNTLSEFGSVARGICRCDSQNRLLDVVELTKIERDGRAARYTDDSGKAHSLTGDEVVSMNMWGFTPSIFDHLKEQFVDFLRENEQSPKAEFFIPTVVNQLMAGSKARVSVLPSQDHWFGITYPGDKPAVIASIGRLVERGVYPPSLWQR